MVGSVQSQILQPLIKRLTLALVLGSLTCSSLALAWGEKGHRLTGLIARELLSTEARTKIRALMGSDDLASFTLYMDINKERLANDIPGSRDWHYDDKPICEDKPYTEYCRNGNCASSQLRRHYRALIDEHSAKSQKRFAIFVLTHLVGDVHQPLHAADNEDRGGNEIRVRVPWNPDTLRLHTAWDSEFVNELYKGRNEVAVAKDLLERFAGRLSSWRTSQFRTWIDESHRLAREIAYGRLPGFSCGADMEDERVFLTTEYIEAARESIPEQLVKAGVRMAHILNRAFAN